jgi:hypothetical protein
MNKRNRILSAVFLTAIYCFAIGIVSQSFSYSDNSLKQTSANEKFILEISTELFCHTSQTLNYLNSFNNLFAPNYDNTYIGLWKIEKVNEQLIETELSQYISFSNNILIKNRKSDLIYPFHYFW